MTKNIRKCHQFSSRAGFSLRSLTTFHLNWGPSLKYAFSPYPSNPSGYPQNQIGPYQADPDCPSMAKTMLILQPCTVGLTSQVSSSSPCLVNSASWPGCSFSAGQSTPFHRDVALLDKEKTLCSEAVKEVLLISRKSSTSATYLS